MLLDVTRARRCLREFDFKKLFIEELGWDYHTATVDVSVDSQSFTLTAIAEKRGMVAFRCDTLPDYATRRKIERQVAKSVHEHLIIYTDTAKIMQIWQWVKREAGKPTACREHHYHRDQPGDALIQKLQALAFSLEEEESLTIVDVARRARAAFDIERVTKRFYDRFKAEHTAFLKFLRGIPDEEMQRWYVSVMLNRLMFIYFIQKKGFLDNDRNYLRTKLAESKQRGKGRFYSDFLCPLFFEGFAKKENERSETSKQLLGKVPYLNGGIFQRHQIEELYGTKIQIADAAVEKLFDFFDQYHWHLDERPLRADNEINPDVLGYIFEKYINQKQMGAYYTKEDITEYISKNTVLPFLFDVARQKCKIAFEGEHSVWRLLQADPDRYIYEAVRRGVINGEGSIIPESVLPDFVQKGMHDPKARMFDNRYNLGEAYVPDSQGNNLALPTETWREYVERRKRCLELRALLQGDTSSGIESGTESGTGVPPVISSPPPSQLFQPFDPSQPVEITRRNLPHWQQEGVTYFVTFRLADSLPQAKLQQWQQEKEAWLKRNPPPWSEAQQAEYAERFPRRLNEWLDAGAGSCLLKEETAGKIVEDALLHFNGERYVLDHYVVMPNHVHALVAPKSGFDLSDILHSWKSFTAHEINKALHRKGTLWFDESYDHIVRSREQLEFYRSYIRENPRKAKLRPGQFRLGTSRALDDIIHPTETATGGTPVPHSWDINDLITYNVNIRQFAQDVIENCEGPELLRAFWHAIENVTVLDPTCGSGAFLFAALNILESLYEACLDRMEAFVSDLVRSDEKHRPEKFSDFRKVLARVAQHPNRRYFVFKTIIVNNLFGVDIMEEAVEICKLRLFLKLVAQVDKDDSKPSFGIEPLPDIDFNIRAGNTLVGYATYDDVKRAVTSKFDFEGVMERIEEKAGDIDRLFAHFRQQQTELGGEVTPADKQELRNRLKTLEDELNRYLAGEYGADITNPAAYEKWLHSHKPFHWFIEFYGIMKRGGFDVIIGNPPYVEYSKVRREYQVGSLQTQVCGNLYAFCAERSYQLLGSGHRFGFIVQAPIVSTQRMAPVRAELKNKSDFICYATFDDRPAKLFDGMHHCRLAIILTRKRTKEMTPLIATTRYHKWYDVERPHLFSCVQYLLLPETNDYEGGFVPKFRSEVELAIFRKLVNLPHRLGELISQISSSPRLYYKITGVGHWFTFTTRPPKFWRDGVEGSSTREENVAFRTSLTRDIAFCCLWSTLHYWLYQARTNCRDFNPSDLEYLPLPNSIADGVPEFSRLAKQIMECLEKTSVVAGGNYSVGGTVSYERFRPKFAKPLFDEVDKILAQHYSFTDEELDFIINYDIKYRMGRDNQTGENDE